MKLIRLALASVLVTAVAVAAEVKPDRPSTTNGATRDWKYVLDFDLPKGNKTPLYDLLLPPAVLEHTAQEDQFVGMGKSTGSEGKWDQPARNEIAYRKDADGLQDLRLFDAQGRQVPYALRVLRPQNTRQPLHVDRFNPERNAQRQISVSLDLGENARHNEIEIRTTGDDFRRVAQVEASDDSKTWSNLIEAGPNHKLELLSFHHNGQAFVVNDFAYPESRRRYVRVVVSPDNGLEKDTPEFEQGGVTLFNTARLPGVYVTNPATLGEREPVRTVQGPGSAWPIDLGGRVPFEKLTFTVDPDQPSFVRGYVLETPLEGGVFQVLTQGTWQREPGRKNQPLEIKLNGNEMVARRLRLVLLDGLNPKLNVTGVTYTAPARQLIFPDRDIDGNEIRGPLSLYVGNHSADEPRYDFARNLPGELKPPPVRIDLKGTTVVANPEYQAPPLPFTERFSWLIYVVLGVATLALAGVLFVLARQALARQVSVNPV